MQHQCGEELVGRVGDAQVTVIVQIDCCEVLRWADGFQQAQVETRKLRVGRQLAEMQQGVPDVQLMHGAGAV